MDIFLPIVICVVLFIIFSVCGWCCKRNRQGTVYGVPGAPVTTVTTATTYGVSNTPYPVDMPMPQHQPGFNVGGPLPYPQMPSHPQPMQNYPPAPVPLGYPPMHMMGGGYITAAPYPPMPTSAYPPAGLPYPSAGPYAQNPAEGQQPPSYAEAVTQPPTNEVYAKQAPYNPNY